MTQQSIFKRQLLSELGVSVWKLREPNLLELGLESSQSATHESQQSKTVAVEHQLLPEAEQQVNSEASPTPNIPELQIAESKGIGSKIPEPQISDVPTKPQETLKQEVLLVNHESLPIADLTLAMETLEIPFEVQSHGQQSAFSYPLMITADVSSADEALEIVHLDHFTPQSKKALWQALLKFKAELKATV